MKRNLNIDLMKSKRLQFIGFTILLLLLIPLVAMQFTSEVNWTLSDFVVGGMLLFGTGIICELVIRKLKKKIDVIIDTINQNI